MTLAAVAALIMAESACIPNVKPAMLAIMQIESSLVPSKVSKTGDYGLGQVNLSVWRGVYRVTGAELLNPRTNTKVSCSILTKIYVRHGHKPDWIGFYHSRHTKPRSAYMRKITRALRSISAAFPRH